MSYDFKMDSEARDLVFTKGKFYTTSTVREVLRQRIYITFRTMVGEWYLNTAFGLYDKDLFLNKRVSKTQVDAYVINKLNQFPEVDSIEHFEGDYDYYTRTYSATFVVKADGETGVFKINLVPPGVEVNYPDPKEDLETLRCEIPDVDRTNAFYEMMNFDLPTTIAWL